MIVDIKKIGKVAIPALFQELVNEESRFVIYKKKDLQNLSSAQKDITNGKLIVITQADAKFAKKLLSYLNKKSEEMLPFDIKAKIASKEFTRNRKKSYLDHQKKILNSLLLLWRDDQIISFKETERLPLIFSFSGSDYYADDKNKISADTEDFIVPLHFFRKLEKKLEESIFVEAIGHNLHAGNNVLVPKSQETTFIFKESLLKLKESKKEIHNTLDMGCGSGVLSILSTQIFSNSHIYFTDILPEAISSTKFNFEKIYNKEFLYNEDQNNFTIKLSDKTSVTAYNSGSLFDKIENKFDIILFNAPWIVTKARNRSELALNDENQEVVAAFLNQAKEHLQKSGNIILGYSDNSGDAAVEKLEEIIKSNNYQIQDVNTKRIQSYQSGRKWMKIFTYTLVLA